MQFFLTIGSIGLVCDNLRYGTIGPTMNWFGLNIHAITGLHVAYYKGAFLDQRYKCCVFMQILDITFILWNSKVNKCRITIQTMTSHLETVIRKNICFYISEK